VKSPTFRLDELLVNRGLAENRSQARGIILAGKVRQGTVILDKPGKKCAEDIDLEVIQPPRFVSRGGDKLTAYLEAHPLPLEELQSLDVGASTGGFTDCLLQNGVKQAVCVDVGRGQLHNKLRLDPRVTNLERINARALTAKDLPLPNYDIIVMDLSFISLKKVLPAIWPLLRPAGKLIALVKPQFEAEKSEVDAGKGIIRDDQIRMRILNDTLEWVQNNLPNSKADGWIECPVHGSDGNREFLAGWKKQASLNTEQERT